MSSSSPSIQNSNITDSVNPEGQLTRLLADGRLTGQASAWLIGNTKRLLDWFKQPHIRQMLVASGISFASVVLLIGSLGFGTAGIGGGTLAAGFQSIFYGGLTPAGSVFATLQSMGALGTLIPAGVGIGAAVAAVVSLIMWLRRDKEEEPKNTKSSDDS